MAFGLTAYRVSTGFSGSLLCTRDSHWQGISDIVEINLLDGGNTTEPGDLQRAVFENRNVHAAQASRGNWVPFRNSTQSSYDLMGGNTCGNAIKDLYPHRLCASKERKMAREDPVEFQVYTSQDPMETTSGASMAPRRNQYHTSVDEVRWPCLP